MVSIVGRPNVGKSTLLNRVLEEKVAIVSKVPQTTRNQVRGIYTDERGQIVFIDTPGLHVGRDKLGKFMNKAAYETIRGTDCLIHLTDTSEPVGKEEEDIVGRLIGLNIPVILGLNKVDLKPKFIHEYIALWERVSGKPVTELKDFVVLPLSGNEGTNIDKLLDVVFEYLPEGPALYPEDTVCDIPQKMVMADIIREKLFAILRQEIPYAVAVVIENVEAKSKKVMHIQAMILVERESQKQIVIGKGGANLKQVGTEARRELEELLENKVFLELFVKTKKSWRDDDSLLQEMGYYLP